MEVLKPPYEVWLCDLTHTQQTIASNSVPLGIGLISAYAKKRFGDLLEIRLFKYPEKLLEEILAKPPQVIGFSNYVWNLDLSCSLSCHLKKLNPSAVVIFGGPNYPLDIQLQGEFLKKRDMIDFYIYREGEQAFCDLLSALIDNNFNIEETKKSSLDNCHYLMNGSLVAQNNHKRMELDDIPSAYTTGILDEFFDGKLMPLIHTNRGCPFSCTFCTESDPYFDKISFRNPESFKADLEYVARMHQGNKNIDITDSNFGMYKNDLIIAQAIAAVKGKYDFPDYIHVATGKTNKERVLEVAKITGGLFRLSASVQSTDPVVLTNIKRKNISISTIVELASKAAKIGSNTYAEIILALPGDTKEAHFKSIEYVINHNLNYIRCYTLMMLKGTELDSAETIAKFGLVTKYRVIPRCYGLYESGGDKLFFVETEKVCVANNTLSFEDYLECRLFALTIEIFYNDGILSELLLFLSQYEIKPFEFLQKIHERRHELPEVLSELYKQFRQETMDELWDSEAELLSFAKNEATIQKYVEGEYGSNLIFKYKAIAFVKLMDAIHDIAFSVANDLIISKKIDDRQTILDFLHELKTYSLLKKRDLLKTDLMYKNTFKYDLLSGETYNFEINPGDFKKEKGVEVCFRHSEQQKEIINGNLEEYGETIVGIGRILSRIHVKKMYRKTDLCN